MATGAALAVCKKVSLTTVEVKIHKLLGMVYTTSAETLTILWNCVVLCIRVQFVNYMTNYLPT